MIGKKTERLYSAAIYLCFGVYMLLCHMLVGIRGDDADLLETAVGIRGFWEHFLVLYAYNGKIFTDYLAFLFCCLPFTLWRVFNTGVFVLVAALLNHLFTDKSPRAALLTCGLLAIFPLWYLGTAGYISTCANYLYPLTGLLLVACQLKALCQGQKIPLYRHFLLLPVCAYILNQDQAACILVGGLLLLLLYVIFLSKKSKQVILWVAAYFLVALAGYVVMFLLPGHLNRMNDPSEMQWYLPEFANWSIGKKLYRGFTATVAHIFFDDTTVCILFFFLLFVTAQVKGNLWCRVVSILPLAGFLAANTLGKERFVHYLYPLAEMKALSTPGGFLGLAFSCLSLCCAVAVICKTCSPSNRYLLLSLLVLGGGSRLMMGFSATLYESGQRTFTYLMFALLAGCIVLLQDLKNNRAEVAYYAGAAGILVALLQK